MKQFISVYGAFPPNIGGVSVHIERLAESLHRDQYLHYVYVNNNRIYKKYPVYCIDVSTKYKVKFLLKFYWLFRYILWDTAKIIHIHGSLYWDLISVLFILKFLRKKVVFTVHDQMQLSKKAASCLLFKSVYCWLSKNSELHFIAVSGHIKEQLQALGVVEEKISVIPAYLNISQNETLDQEVKDFRERYTCLISVYAHAVNKAKEKDIYGVDWALRVLEKLVREGEDAGMIICIPTGKDEEMVKEYQYWAIANKVEAHVLFVCHPVKNVFELWAESDIYLRPTLTDGDSVAVREALSVGTVVVASNVVRRPSECIVFQSENLDDLYRQTKNVLAKQKTSRGKKEIVQINDNYQHLLSVYRKLL